MLHTIGSIPAEKLLGMQVDLHSKLQSGAISIHEFDRFLKGEDPFVYPKRVTIGTFRDHLQLTKALIGANVSIDNETLDYLDRVPMHGSKKKVDIGVVTGRELGFTSQYSYDDIFRLGNAGSDGFNLCLPEVAPVFRLNYRVQPKEEEIIVAMYPAANFSRVFFTFVVGADDKGMKYIELRPTGSGYSLDTKWLFARESLVR